MKNKEKFVKIANIVTKVLVVVLVALLVLCIGVVCFRACSAPHDIAYASEADGIGIWVWNEFIPEPSSYENEYSFSFICNGIDYSSIELGIVPGYDFCISYLSSQTDSSYIYGSGDFLNGWEGGLSSVYRTIDIKTAPPSDFLTILEANATYQSGGTEPVVYTVAKRVSGCNIEGDSTISPGETKEYQLVPVAGRTLPETVQVIGATYTYNNLTGFLTLSNPTSNVGILGTAGYVGYSLSVILTNGVNQTLGISQEDSLSVQLQPNDGYGYPTSVSVVGCTLSSYNASTGVAVVRNPTGDCRLTGVCPFLYNPAGSIRGVYTFLSTVNFTDVSPTIEQTVNFTTNNNGVVTSWTHFNISSNGTILFKSGTRSRFVYSTTTNGGLLVGWQSPQYQTVDFGDSYQPVSSEFLAWVKANSIPESVQDSESYQLGYNAGYNAGDTAGYNRGYNAGLAEGQNNVLHGAEGVIAGTAGLFDVKIFGAFSMLDMLLVVFGIGIAIWFLKMFAGG